MKVSYIKEFAPNGTVYTQTLRVSSGEFLGVAELLHHEKDTATDSYIKMHLKDLNHTQGQPVKNGIKFYLNLTQLKYIIKHTDNKRIKQNRNTILYLDMEA